MKMGTGHTAVCLYLLGSKLVLFILNTTKMYIDVFRNQKIRVCLYLTFLFVKNALWVPTG